MTKNKSIKEIGELLAKIKTEKDPFIEMCLKDERKGVSKLVERWRKNQAHQIMLEQKWVEMTAYEREVWEEGYQHIAGVDEVGRGPLAGPVVAAAVILPRDFRLLGLDDSKKMNEKKREEYYQQILDGAIAIGIGIVHQNIIDDINIYEATKIAMQEAINNMKETPDYVLIDAMKLPLTIPQQSIIKGDAKSVSISAASIIAKVTRDRLMNEYGLKYPQYGFKNNMGYGTKEHLEALNTYGLTPWHRLSFAPVKDIAKKFS